MKILFVVAHPADLIDQSGGVIRNHVLAGHDVYTLSVTHGKYSHPPSLSEDYKSLLATRYKVEEVKEGLDILDVKASNMHFMDKDDALYLRNDYISNFPMTLCRDIAFHIQNVKPDILVTHHPSELNHPDHAKIGKWTMEAITAASRLVDRLYYGADQYQAHTVRNIYFYGYQFRPWMVKMGQNVLPPDVIIDITKVVNDKAMAFVKMKSQHNTWDIVMERLNSQEKETGRLYGFGYAESFISLHPAKMQLLPDWNQTDFYSLLKEKADG
jgi:LmbE family N-acetylglucosaminyl deacetylase